jgi:hypothetical protein
MGRLDLRLGAEVSASVSKAMHACKATYTSTVRAAIEYPEARVKVVPRLVRYAGLPVLFFGMSACTAQPTAVNLEFYASQEVAQVQLVD